MTRSVGMRVLCAGAAAALGMMQAGCSHSNAEAAASGNGSRPTGVTKAQQIQAVENDPHIPAQTKAMIVRQLKGGPPLGAEKHMK